MSEKLVSVLIPTYNRKNIVTQAIDSALAQTYKNIEIIVIDNASTDGTFAYLKSKYEPFKNVIIKQNETNVGPVNNWIRCVEEAKGEYIKFVFSDDLMSERFIEKAVAVLENDAELGFVYSEAVVCKVGDKRKAGFIACQTSKDEKIERNIFFERMCESNGAYSVSPGNALFRKEVINIAKEIPNRFKLDHSATGAGTDLLIFLNALVEKRYFYHLDEVMNFFRMHSGSFTCSNDLYIEYFTCKTYFFTQVYQSKKCRKILLKSLIKDYFLKNKSCWEIYQIARKNDLNCNFIKFLYEYLNRCFKEI